MSLDDDVRNLGEIPIFADLEPEALRLIAFSGEMRILRAGDVLFRHGDTSDSGYVILTGSIALHKDDNGGPPAQIVGPKGLIGEIALITETERPVTAIARETTTVLRVPRTLFHRVLKEFPRSAASLRAKISARLTNFTAELNEVRKRSFDD